MTSRIFFPVSSFDDGGTPKLCSRDRRICSQFLAIQACGEGLRLWCAWTLQSQRLSESVWWCSGLLSDKWVLETKLVHIPEVCLYSLAPNWWFSKCFPTWHCLIGACTYWPMTLYRRSDVAYMAKKFPLGENSIKNCSRLRGMVEVKYTLLQTKEEEKKPTKR